MVTTQSEAASVRLHPPGPNGLPFFGCLNGLLRNPMRFWTRIARRYGGIARVPLKSRHVYLISDPDVLYELFVTKRKKYRKNTRYKAAVDTFGAGLLLNEGEAWQRQRKITQPAFKADYIDAQVPWMSALVSRFLSSRWEPEVGRIRDVDEDFLRLSQLVAGRYLMGPGFARIAEPFYAAAVAVKNHWPLPPRGVLATFAPASKTRARRLEEATAELEGLLYGYFTEHRESDFDDCGVLGAIVKASRAQGDEFDDRSLRDQLLTLFFAGHETSAVSLSWIHYLLSTHPRVRARLQREVRGVLADRLPAAADLPRLPYTEQVVNESLRLYSPIHSISRVALEEDRLGGYSIPAGSTIYVSLHAVHRLPRLWPDPDRFDPDRFEPERCAARQRFAFMPFAAGHRNCIGGLMAMTELKIVVAEIARRYVLDVAPGHRVEAAPGTTMHPRHGMRMTIRHVGVEHASGALD